MAGSTGTPSRRPIGSGSGRVPEARPAPTRARLRPFALARVPVEAIAITLALVLACVSTACLTPPIHVEASDADALRAATAIAVRLAPTKAGAAPSVSEATAEALLDRVRAELRAGAHPLVDEHERDGRAVDAGDGAGLVALELALLEQPVTRRTYTGDTDANGARLEARTEGVVVLRALEADGRTELWRCTARGLLPKPGARFGPTATEVFERLLERALERVPDRS